MKLGKKSRIWREASNTFIRKNSDARGYGNNYTRDYNILEKSAPVIRGAFERVGKTIWRLYKIVLATLSIVETGDRTTYKKYRYDLGINLRKSMRKNLPEVFQDYEKYLHEQNQFLSYSSARIFYYYTLFRDELTSQSDVIEIGAGYGNLAEIILNKHEIKRYVIVDLPEVIEFSKKRLRNLYPHIEIIEDIDQSRSMQEKHVLFVEASDGFSLCNDRFDLAVNTESFAEMDLQVSDQYFELLALILKPRATFVSINRFLRVIGDDPSQINNLTSPLLNDPKELAISSMEIDKFRAMFPCFRSEPNLVTFYTKSP